MADPTQDKDYQDYQDYLEYQKHVQAQPQPADSAQSPAQAGLEHFANSATLGQLPKMQAGVGSLLGLGDYDKLKQENDQRLQQESQQSPKASLGGEVGGALVPGFGAGKGAQGIAKLIGKGAIGRLVGSGVAGAALGGAQEGPSGILPGAAMGGGGQLLGEAASALGKGIKSAYKAFSPGSSEENIGNIKNLLKGKSVTVNPGRLTAADDTGQVEHLLKQEYNPTTGENPMGGTYGTSIPPSMEIPAEKAHEIRSILDKQVNWQSPAGPDRAKEIAGASNDVRSQLHNLSPQVDAAYKDLESSLGANKNLSKAINEMSKGDVTHAYRLGSVPLAESIKGGVRSAISDIPQATQPAATAGLAEILDLTKKQPQPQR